MKFIVGAGLRRYVPAHAVVAINDFKGEQSLGVAHCMVELVNGYSFMAKGSAEDKHQSLLSELATTRGGHYKALSGQ